MTLRPSRILRELRNGANPCTLKLNLNDPRVIEMAGLSGASGVWICNEHVPNDWSNLEHQVRAARLHDLDSIVRVSKGAYSDYVKAFELDATAIMVPHVSTAEEARKLVEMTRFQPLGRRPIDGGNIDGGFCQVPIKEYLHHSNTEKILIFQIESPEALAQVEEIASVPGYDVLLFGPGDFSHLIGKAGQIHDPEVVAARKRVAAAGRKHGKHLMMPGMIGPRRELEEEGWRIFNLGADVLCLGSAFNQLVAEYQGTPAVAPAAVYNSSDK
ncbi:aldolase/citrate lyase family protein [Verrucomicrobium sp. BvORR106]|uniref:HpcH/HpaI aldolase family protein n=1 Tax=Verrucomicrobium sp. BvORR106 TaxID=1403819 RepID=UPI00056E5C93|nr:aldolase/citrate lyase family protein [Verrucomicrobium sp. BvORR106]